MPIREYMEADREAVVRLALRAWAPVFVSLEQVLDPRVYRIFFPDWRECQRQAVETACSAEKNQAWVADEEGVVAGFAVALIQSEELGEIHMIAVDPDYQRRGLARALTAVALDWMRARNVPIAMVETGGDPGHAPARATYEECGFRLFPVARYFMKL